MQCMAPAAACTDKQSILPQLDGSTSDTVRVGYTYQAAPSVVVFTTTTGSDVVVTQYTAVQILDATTGIKIRWRIRGGTANPLYYFLIWDDGVTPDTPTSNTLFYLSGVTEGSSASCDARTKCSQTFVMPYSGILGMPQLMTLVANYDVPAAAMVPPIADDVPRGGVLLSTRRVVTEQTLLTKPMAAFMEVVWYLVATI